MGRGLAAGVFTRATLREALYLTLERPGLDPLSALESLVEGEGLAELFLYRNATWQEFDDVRDAPTAATVGTPPSAGELAAAKAAAEAASEDREEVARWLIAIDSLSDAETIRPKAGASLAPSRGGGAPESIAGYRVIREIARGGMGVVYLGEDLALERRVAIKVVRDAGLAEERELKRFQVEARAAAALKHAGIVAVHAYGVEEGRPYLVMDWVEGESLAARLRREGPLEPREAARLTRDLAEALAHAHRSGVLHRDLKPGNALVDREGRALLTDFGLAKRVEDEGEGLTITGQVLGTPAFMSPEQADGAGEVDVRSDVYGLGATLYALLLDRPPFVGVGTLDTLNAVFSKEVPRVRALRPEVDPALEAICLRCLEKEPERRYPSAIALAEDLGRYLAGEAVRAKPPSRLRRWARAVRRRPAPFLALVAALGLGISLSLKVELDRSGAVREHLDEAHRRAQLGASSEEIEREVEAALALDSSLPTQLECARILRSLGLGERARALLEQAASDHPPGIEALLELHEHELGVGATRLTDALERALEAARASQSPSARDRVLRLYAEGAALLKARPAAAKALFSEALAAAPRFAWALISRAEAHIALGEGGAALADYSEALRVDPRNFVARINRGTLREDRGDLAGAREDYLSALRLAPGNGHAHLALGLLEQRAERWDPALAHFDRARERFAAANQSAEVARIEANAAWVELELGLFEQASQRALRALEASVSGRAAARANTVLAEVMVRGDRASNQTLAYLDAALQADPTFFEALLLRGDLRRNLDDLNKAVASQPNHAEARRVRAQLLVSAGDTQGARADLDHALSTDPGDAEAYLLRGDLSVLEEDRTRALEDYQSAITARPTWSEPYAKRALLYLRAGAHAEAEDDLVQALNRAPASDHLLREKLQRWLKQLRSRQQR